MIEECLTSVKCIKADVLVPCTKMCFNGGVLDVGIKSLPALGPWPWVSALLPVLVLILVKWLLAYLYEVLWACQGKVVDILWVKHVRIKHMGSGIVSTEIDGCLSSYTEVELEAKTHSSPCVEFYTIQCILYIYTDKLIVNVLEKWLFIWAEACKTFLMIRFLLHKFCFWLVFGYKHQ